MQEPAAIAKTLKPPPGRAPLKFAAIPNCRKSRNARKNDCEPARHARKTSLRTPRNATARRPQIQKDDPATSGALTASSSIHDKLHIPTRRFQSAFSRASIVAKRNLL